MTNEQNLRPIVQLDLRPYAMGRGPTFSIKLWELTEKSDLPPSIVRVGYRLLMDDNVVVEGEDFQCARSVAADSSRALDGFFGFFADPAFIKQQAEQFARKAVTVEQRDQYLRMLAYLPHCECIRSSAMAALH